MLNVLKTHRKLVVLSQQCRCFAGDAKNSTSSADKVPALKGEEFKTEVAPKKSYDSKEVTKEDMQWRTPWHKQEGEYFSMLRSFYTEDNNRSLMQFIQQPIDLRPSTIKKAWLDWNERKEKFMQQYIPERNQMLGNELAAAHFIVYRGGAVKFHGQDKWIKADEERNYSLPTKYQDNMYLEAIDCSDMDLYYEGLVNLRGLKNVNWLSLRGCKHMDDWCMDRIGNIFSHSLVYLDLRDCMNVTERGIGCLYKLRNLKILYLEDLLKDTRYEMTCLLLEEIMPNLEIRSNVINFERPQQ